MARVLLSVIRFYRRVVSPMTPPSCRFTPTCSAYAEEAVRRHGAARGGWLALKRLLRCHPFGGSGYDPVPAGSHGDETQHGPPGDG
jgi:putative membrane protein insertion efficiency factor